MENHRVMLYANEIEMAAVRDLLVQLGEVAPKEGNNAKLRVIPGGSRQEAEELLERIRRAWPAVAPNPLAVPPSAPDLQKSESEPQKATPPQPTPVSPSKTTVRDPDAGVFQLARLSHDAAAEEGVKSQPESAGQATAPSRSDAGKSAAKEGRSHAAAGTRDGSSRWADRDLVRRSAGVGSLGGVGFPVDAAAQRLREIPVEIRGGL